MPGFREEAIWMPQAEGAGTRATHTFQHTGPLAALLRNAYRGVAELRLQRVSHRLLTTGSCGSRG